MDGFRYEDGKRWTKDKCTLCQCKVSMRTKYTGWITETSQQNQVKNRAQPLNSEQYHIFKSVSAFF